MEPRSEPANFTIINEMEEFLEVTFFVNTMPVPGIYKIGYTLNNKLIFVKAYSCKHKGNVIGGYGCTFNKRAIICYRTVTPCYGHFIRKTYWQKLLKDCESNGHKMLIDSIKLSMDHDYRNNTAEYIMRHK